MSILPLDPASPFGRYILFADASHVTQVFNESLQTVGGVSFTSEAISQSLNRQQAVRRKATMRVLTLDYVAAGATTILVAVSGDGGANWSEQNVSLLASTQARVQTVSVPCEVTGYDIRYRLRYPNDVLVTVIAATPYLTVRGRTNVN